MTTKDFELVDKGTEVVKAAEVLTDATEKLAELNDEPHLHQDEVEGFIAAIIRIVTSVLKN